MASAASASSTRPLARIRGSVPAWPRLSDEQLLGVRLRDLNLRIDGTPLARCVRRLYAELEGAGLNFRPHCWLAEEWFSPDGVPGIAIPFYLAHPRLMRLERKQMLEVEGGAEDWCLKILRHEAGHAFDTAYRLHRRGEYRQHFGRYAAPYPDTYKAKPYSKSFVLHLEPWYAQAHPAEDFAETFAVWLKPRSRWRSHYENWPAIKKLEYVDRLMGEIRGTRAQVLSREHVDALKDIKQTLGEHYQQKRDRYGLDHPKFNDRVLRRVVAHWTGEYQYTIDQVLEDMIDRCRELNLRIARPQRALRREALVMLTVQTMNYLHAGHHRLVL